MQLQNRAPKNLKYLPNGNEFRKMVIINSIGPVLNKTHVFFLLRFAYICSQKAFEGHWSKFLRLSLDLCLEVHMCELGGICPITIHIGVSRNNSYVSDFIVEWFHYLNREGSYENLTDVQQLELTKMSLVKPCKTLLIN